ncbi:hypothetical protein C8R46DRAFT_1346767 [Mycena filopes]|nr:hypothetical protein C8R46DRAFT_1346767 [Mycena filopes]
MEPGRLRSTCALHKKCPLLEQILAVDGAQNVVRARICNWPNLPPRCDVTVSLSAHHSMGKKQKPGSEAGVPRPRGRPKKQYIEKGKAKVLNAVKRLLRSLSPALPPDAPALDSGIPLSAEDARATFLAGEEYGVASDRQDHDKTPVYLQHVKRDPARWTHLATVNTEDVPKWFHEQNNDFDSKDYSDSQVVDLTWFGHPGDSTHDARARKFLVHWSKRAPKESGARTTLIEKEQPVCRWTYTCAGVHDMAGGGGSGGRETRGSEDDSDTDTHSSASSATAAPQHRRRWKKCGDEVQLHLEVTAEDLRVVQIWQKGTHDEAAPDQMPHLMFSRFLRLQIMDRFRRYGAKVSSVQRDLVDNFLLPSSSGAEALPAHRIPTTKQAKGMFSTGRQRTRLDRNPFRATWLMVKRNGPNMYNYTPHDFEKPDSESKFTVGITDDFSMDSIIDNTRAPNGTLFVDSTHRMRNDNRAATTVLCTADDGQHMMPGAYLISANIQAKTIKEFLVETIQKVEARAAEIVADPSKVQHRDPATRDRILKRCQHIVENGFDCTNINMDKSRSQLNGILDALEELGMHDTYLRLCQFHVVQAILGFHTDRGPRGIGFAIPTSTKFEMVVLFRILQRCRSYEQWEESKRVFHEGLRVLLDGADQETLAKQAAAEDELVLGRSPAKPRAAKPAPQPRSKKAKQAGRTCLQVVQAYFDDNWFVQPWIPMFTDIGLPPEQSRDGTWNTNNWAETAFKQFNAVFLDNKHNKRIDHLAAVILNHHLPFFRFFRTPDRPESKELIQLHHRAEQLWERDMVVAAPDLPHTFTVRRTIVTRVDGVASDAVQSLQVAHTVVLNPLGCTCHEYEQTGKVCVDIEAARILRTNGCVDIVAAKILQSNGPVENWKKTEYETEKRKGDGKAEKDTKMLNDATVDRELDSVFVKLRSWEQREQDRDLEPKFGEFKVLNTGGRPSKMRPIHPWRTKNRIYATAGTYSYSPRFTKKRGPRKRGRLNWNSVFPHHIRDRTSRFTVYLARLRRHRVGGAFVADDAAVTPPLVNGASGGKDGDAGPNDDEFVRTGPNDDDDLFNAEDLDLNDFGPTEPNDDDFLNAEDLDLDSFTGTRWASDNYELRLDELHIFIAFFNSSAMAIESGIIFLSMIGSLAAQLRAVDWASPLSTEALCQAGGLTGLAELISSRKGSKVRQIISFKHLGSHWTTVHHVVDAPQPRISWINSLPPPNEEVPAVDSQDDLLLHYFFQTPRPQVQPLHQPWTLNPLYLDLQHDSKTCGFWAVYVAFSLLLIFPMVNDHVRSLDIKELVCPIYLSFIGDERGVPASLVANLFCGFAPVVTLANLPSELIISYRPAQYQRAPGYQNTPNSPLDRLPPSRNYSTVEKSAGRIETLDVNYIDLLPSEDGFAEEQHWEITSDGQRSVTARRLRMLTDGGLTSDSVMDGYFSLLTADIAKQTDVAAADLAFVFTDSDWGQGMMAARRDASGMSPPARSNARHGVRERWFEKFNIFDKNRLLVPIFWTGMKHWLFAAAFFESQQIRIYDSILFKAERRHKAAYGRLFEVLKWEHMKQYGDSLPSTWMPFSTEVVVEVPQQRNSRDCGIFSTGFGEQLAYGATPTEPATIPFDPQHGRLVIANRLNAAIRACPQNQAALGISLVVQPPSPPVVAAAPPATPSPSGFGVDVSARRYLPLQLRIGYIAFFREAGLEHGHFLPADTVAVVEGGFTMEWLSTFLFMDEERKPQGQFFCSEDSWKEAGSLCCSPDHLVPVMWPAARAGIVHRRFVTDVLPSDTPVLNVLRSHSLNAIDYVSGARPESTLFALMHQEFTMQLNPVTPASYDVTLFPSLRSVGATHHESILYEFIARIQDPFERRAELRIGADSPAHAVAEAVGSAYLWAAYVGCLTGTNSTVAYTALKEDRVHWPETELQIMVPHLPLTPPVILPMHV